MNIKMVLPFMVLFCTKLITQTNNCSFTLTQNLQNPSCPTSEDGAIFLEIDGIEPFTFQWSSAEDSTFQSQVKDLENIATDSYSLILTDGLDCIDTLEFLLSSDLDTIPPIIQCPDNQVINLGAGHCDKVVEFIIFVSDDCGATILSQLDNTGLNSGSAFPIGEHWLSFEVSDGFQKDSCSFSITVNEYQVNGNPIISCATNLNVSVGLDCSPSANADLFLISTQHGCYDDYELFYTNSWGFPIIGDFSAYINETLSVKVTDPETGNNCISQITLHDFLAPNIYPMDTLMVTCGKSLSELYPSVTGYPTVAENCGGYTLTFSDLITEFPCGDSIVAVLKRTWLALDEYNNLSTPYEQIILFERKTLADVIFPLNLTDQVGQLPSLGCNADVIQTSPLYTGAPSIDGISLLSNTIFCDFGVNFTDQIVAGCGAGYDIIRTWTVLDECQNQLQSHIQIIRLKDQTPPEMTCPSDYSVSTNQSNCGASFFIPLPVVSDNCNEFEVETFSPFGNIINNVIFNMPLGAHPIIFKATDICGNEAECQTLVTVFDGNAPTAICKPSKQVSLIANGTAYLAGNIFNNGSYDDCSNVVNFQIRRLEDACNFSGTDWANGVQVCCADIGTPVPVEIKVIDYDGNYNTCSSLILVTEGLLPNLICPTDVQIDCGFDYSDLSIFGKIADSPNNQVPIIINGATVGQDGLAFDNCGLSIEELPSTNSVSICGEGLITRHFKVTDFVGLTKTCEQYIYVVNNDPFYVNSNDFEDSNDDVIFPPDVIISDCNANTNPSETGTVVILKPNCAEASYTYYDEVFNLPNGVYTIQRHWTVIDFCQFNGINGVWEYSQYITIENADLLPPQFSGIQEVWDFCLNENDCNTGEIDLVLNASDNCTQQNDLSWNYSVDLFNDGIMDVFGNANTISGSFPLGIHRIIFATTDQNGNTAVITQFIVLEDCTAPVLNCPDLSIDLDENGFVNLQTTDFQSTITDNCSDAENTEIALSFYDENYTDFLPPTESATFLAFGCPDTLYHVSLFVGDESENWNTCDFHLKINDSNGFCNDGEPTISISGNIQTEMGEVVEFTELTVNNAPPASSANGFYAFYNLPLGGDFSVFPQRNDDHKNGVTTIDLVLIRKHILGSEFLDSPYKMIAADANHSNSISTLDLVEIRKLVLNNIETFTNNTSWRFVDADFEFPNPENPFETYFPETVSFNNLFDNGIANFVGIKIGDVNGSAVPNALLAADDRSDDKEIEPTEEIIQINPPFPNPFMDKTTFQIYLPEAQHIFLQITDLQGNIILRQENYLIEGWQSLEVSNQDLSKSGLYFYEIKWGKERMAGKLFKK